MKRFRAGAVLVLAAVTGCRSTGGTAASPAQPNSAAPASAAASASAAAPATAAAPTTAAAPATASTGAVADPCALVTPADVAKVVGRQVGTPRSPAVGLYRQCVYTGGLAVEVRAIDRATFDKSAPMNPGNPKPLAGVGAAAYLSSQGILVWKNGTEVVIAGRTGDQDRQLALIAVGRLS